MGTPRITVSIAYWRCRDYLRAAVESILQQTFGDFYLVVVNDADPDEPWDLLADIDDPRLIRFSLRENRGLFFVQEVVLRATPTPYFAVQDADDLSQPTRLERLLEAIEREDAAAAFSSITLDDGYIVGFEQRYLDGEFRHRYAHQGLMRVGALRAIGGYYGGFRVGWDSFLTSSLALAGAAQRREFKDRREPIAFVEEPLYRLRSRADSLTCAAETGMYSQTRREAVARYITKWEAAWGARDAPDLSDVIRKLVLEDVPAEHLVELAEAASALAAKF